MRRRRSSVLVLVAALAATAAITACAAPFARVPQSEWKTGPEPGKAFICILYGGSGWGGSFATVFVDDGSGQDRYVGTLFNKTHLTLQLDPGTYLFSVVGETVDLMRVTVEAGKSYHGLIAAYLAPSAAVVRNSYGHYRFEAINDPSDPRLAQWLAVSAEVVPNEKGRADAAGHLKRLAKMKPEYLPRWEAMDDPQILHVPTPHPGAPSSAN